MYFSSQFVQRSSIHTKFAFTIQERGGVYFVEWPHIIIMISEIMLQEGKGSSSPRSHKAADSGNHDDGTKQTTQQDPEVVTRFRSCRIQHSEAESAIEARHGKRVG